MSGRKLLAVFFVPAIVLVLAGAASYFFLSQGTSRLPAVAPIETVSIPVNATSSKYCLDGQCWEANGASIFRELFGTRLNAVASNTPADYLGPVVSGFYFDDQWLTACQPLRQKVDELVSGKTTDSGKALAMANWVTRSGRYGGAVSHSICDLFSARTGVCADAAALSTAMLRIAGVPARVVDPKTNSELGAHEYTAVFADGKWMAIDATFGGGERRIFEPTAILNSLTYHKFDKPREIVIPGFNDSSSSGFSYYLTDGVFSLTHVKSDLISEGSSKKVEPYGTMEYIKPKYSSQDLGYVGNAILIAKDLQCDYYECRRSPGAETEILLPQAYTMLKVSKIMHVANGKIGQELNDGLTTGVDLLWDYHVLAAYPAGSYRFVYKSSNLDQVLAYYDFELPSSGNVAITPDKLSKGSGISDVEFNGFIAYLKGVQ